MSVLLLGTIFKANANASQGFLIVAVVIAVIAAVMGLVAKTWVVALIAAAIAFTAAGLIFL